MAQLAEVHDIEIRLGRDMDAAETIRAAALIIDASAAVVGYTGQQILAASSTARLRVRNGAVQLPQRPVTAVSTVVDDNANDVEFTWVSGDRVTVAANVPDSWAWVPWRNGYEWVTVTYTHGYDEVPDEIVAVVCQVVLRALGRPAESAGVVQESESIDAYSHAWSYGGASGAGPVGLLADERAVLDRYRRIGSVISTL